MSIAQEPRQRFTYADYVTWPDEERWELIEGVPYDMTPAPSTGHQHVVGQIFIQVGTWLQGKPCRAFVSPIDVLLPERNEADEEVMTVVQPDIIVVCDEAKITRRGIRGAPDFVLEVLSPSTAPHDQITKAAVYEKHGVREFWVVDADTRLITIRTRDASRAFSTVRFVKAEGKVPVSVLPEFEVDFDLVFAQMPTLK